MKLTQLSAIGAICALASACTQPGATPPAATAAAPPPGTPTTAVAYTDSARGTTPGCPAIRWYIDRKHDNSLVGYFFFTNASGVSQATGSVDPSGQFQITLTNLDGDGPVGVVTGSTSPDGAFNGVLKGQGCSNASIQTGPVPTLMGPSAG